MPWKSRGQHAVQNHRNKRERDRQRDREREGEREREEEKETERENRWKSKKELRKSDALCKILRLCSIKDVSSLVAKKKKCEMKMPWDNQEI